MLFVVCYLLLWLLLAVDVGAVALGGAVGVAVSALVWVLFLLPLSSDVAVVVAAIVVAAAAVAAVVVVVVVVNLSGFVFVLLVIFVFG